MLLYSVAAASFALLLLQMFSSMRLFASIIPVLITVMMVICPVFYDYRNIRPIQHLFPPTLFINAAYEKHYIPYMLIYIASCCALIYPIRRVKKVK